MNCPKCGAKISSDDSYCDVCGKQIKFTSSTPPDKPESNSFYIIALIILSIFTFFTLVSIIKNGGLGIGQKYNMVITPLETKDKSIEDLLNTAISMDNATYQIIKKLPRDKATKLFIGFYKNLYKISEKINDKNSNNAEKSVIKDFLNQNPELYNIEYNSWKNIWMNHKYLDKTYSKYLDFICQEYIKYSLESIITDIYKNQNTNPAQIANEIFAWQKFISKHPNFELNFIIKENIKTELIFFLANKNSFDDNGYLKTRYIITFDEFLQTFNKDSEEYQLTDNAYKILKNNKMKINNDYINALTANIKNEQLIKEIKEINKNTKQKTQEIKNDNTDTKTVKNKYTSDKIDYDRNIISNAFNEANQYCDKHLYDLDNNNTPIYPKGTIASCIQKVLFDKGEEYKRAYMVTLNYCKKTNSKNVKDCLFEELAKTK